MRAQIIVPHLLCALQRHINRVWILIGVSKYRRCFVSVYCICNGFLKRVRCSIKTYNHFRNDGISVVCIAYSSAVYLGNVELVCSNLSEAYLIKLPRSVCSNRLRTCGKTCISSSVICCVCCNRYAELIRCNRLICTCIILQRFGSFKLGGYRVWILIGVSKYRRCFVSVYCICNGFLKRVRCSIKTYNHFRNDGISVVCIAYSSAVYLGNVELVCSNLSEAYLIKLPRSVCSNRLRTCGKTCISSSVICCVCCNRYAELIRCNRLICTCIILQRFGSFKLGGDCVRLLIDVGKLDSGSRLIFTRVILLFICDFCYQRIIGTSIYIHSDSYLFPIICISRWCSTCFTCKKLICPLFYKRYCGELYAICATASLYINRPSIETNVSVLIVCSILFKFKFE